MQPQPLASATNASQIRGGFPVTDQQAAIVDYVAAHPVTVVAAGAGSGKTYTTVATVLHLIETTGASVDQFVLITFTNKAADSLREQVQQAIHRRAIEATSPEERYRWRQQQERLAASYVGTIHGFCRRVLRLFGYLNHVAHDASVSFARHLRDEVFNEHLEEHLRTTTAVDLYGGRSAMSDYEMVNLTGAIYDHVRNQGYRFEDIVTWTAAQPDDPGKPYRVAMAQFVTDAAETYRARKLEKHVLDPHDLLQETAELLTGDFGDPIAKRLAQRYRYLFVDEFQDTDAVQKEIVERLIPYLKATLVVGDRKQSIYAFRGTQVALLQSLARDYMERDPLPMNVSRRPTEPFLRAQNTLFTSMADRYPFLGEPLEPYDEILPGEGNPPPFIYLHAPAPAGRRVTRADRIASTAQAIRSLLTRHTLELERGCLEPVQTGHIVVLTRTNRILQDYVHGLQAEFAGGNVEIRPDAGEAFYAQPEIASTTYMLQLVLAYPDDKAFSLGLDTPYFRDVDATEEVRRQVQQPARGNPLSNWLQDRHSELHAHLEELQRLVRTATVPQLLEQLYRLFRIREYYTVERNLDAVQNLEHLREVARSLFGEDQALTLHTFVDFLRTATLTGRQEDHVEPPEGERWFPSFIRVMTMHRAKGLEFPVVIIPEVQAPLIRVGDDNEPPFLIIGEPLDDQETPHGLEVQIDLIPDEGGAAMDTRSDAFQRGLLLNQRNALQEEMRVLYVAVTRAEHVAILIGSGRIQSNSPGSPYYSWKDEILHARRALETHGALFRT